ncbi:MAG: SLATT domain-containing protein [Bdellovibrionales bacterium]|nr:SLATT domain-containing protein [Bdellovibrionales bacterium]
MKITDQNVIVEFRKRLQTTQYCRFNYSERLRESGNSIQTLITFYSLLSALISTLSLANVLTLNNLPAAISAFFGVAIATASSVLSSGKYQERSSKALDCGNSIGELISNIDAYANNDKLEVPIDVYNSLNKKYYDLLKEYENHNEIDKLASDLNNKSKEIKNYLKINSVGKWFAKDFFLIVALYFKVTLSLILKRRPYVQIFFFLGVLILAAAIKCLQVK